MTPVRLEGEPKAMYHIGGRSCVSVHGYCPYTVIGCVCYCVGVAPSYAVIVFLEFWL